MDTFTTSEQVEAQNIISLFGDEVEMELEHSYEIDESENERNALIESMKMKEDDIFSLKIANPETSLEAGFFILADQIKELRLRMAKTSFYLADLENLLT